jgi:general secretion pathway protein J
MRRTPGFTLIEVVVSLAILSLVMLATVSGLRTLAATQGSLEGLVERNDEIRSVSGFLRNALESAVIGSDSGGLSLGGGYGEMTFFEIQGSALLWKSVLLMGESYGGSYILRLAREGADLVLRWTPEASLESELNWNRAPARTLAKGLDGFTVAYRRSPGGPWLDEWDGRGAPGWVRLRIESAGRYWPDIVSEVAR